MKNYFIIGLLVLFTSITQAETYNIIVSGKSGGTFHTRSMLMHDALSSAGHDVDLINAGNLSKAAQTFNTTNQTVMMPWMDSANLKENLQPTTDTFGVLEYTAPVVFCSTKYKSFDAPVIKIGHSASWPTEIFDELASATGTDVQPVPYRNSGDLVLGFVSEEIDYIAISMSKLSKLPQGSCFAVTNEQTLQGIPPMHDLLPDYSYNDVKQHAYWLVKNADQNLINAMIQAISTEEYSSWINSKSFVIGKFSDSDLEKSRQGAVDWGLR